MTRDAILMSEMSSKEQKDLICKKVPPGGVWYEFYAHLQNQTSTKRLGLRIRDLIQLDVLADK